MFEDLALNALVFAIGGFILAFAASYALKSRKNPVLSDSPVLNALFAGLLVGAVAYTVSTTRNAEPVYIPFLQWGRVSEIGYKAIWLGFAKNVLPFVPAGFILAKVFKKCDKLRKAAVIALCAAAITAVCTFIAHGFNADCVVGGFLGILVGFGLFAFIKLFFTKTKFFAEPKMSRVTHISSLLVVLGIYMACVALIVVDSGGDFEKLNIYTPDNPLPSDITLDVGLSSDRSTAMTYKTVEVSASEGAEKVASAFGMTGTAQAYEGGDISKRAVVTDGGKSVNYSITGEWKYTDDSFTADGEGTLMPLSEYENIALEISRNGSLPFSEYTVDDVSSGKMQDAAGNTANTVSVYLIANGVDGPVQGSCEVEIVLWYDGTVYSVDKYNADFEEYKSMPIISQQEAWEMAESGGGAHTLWKKAVSATITKAELAYWLEEIKGYLQPIWMFSGTAVTEDGDTVEFQVFVPAMVY